MADTSSRGSRITIMDPLITTNAKIMHGTPCFAGTRVAVQTFFDHLKAGYTRCRIQCDHRQ